MVEIMQVGDRQGLMWPTFMGKQGMYRKYGSG